MELDITAFFLKLVENNAVLSVALFLFYFGVKKAMEYHNIQQSKLVEAQDEKHKLKEEMTRTEFQHKIEDLQHENKELRKDIEIRLKSMEGKHEIFESKLTRNLNKLYGKLELIGNDLIAIKSRYGLSNRQSDKQTGEDFFAGEDI